MIESGEGSLFAGDGVQVAVRVRPLNSNDQAAAATHVLDIKGGTINVLRQWAPGAEKLPENKGKSDVEISFNYDHVFDSSTPGSPGFASQRDVFNGIGIPLVLNAVLGFNASIFAYGQTGSGKSHTMMGSKDHPGMIPLVSHALFTMVEKRFEEGCGVTVEGSYIEVYQERVFDLLGDSAGGLGAGQSPRGGKSSQPTGLRLREDAKTGIFVEGLSSHPVASYQDVAALLEAGLLRRTVAATNMNLESSRSHSVFCLDVTQRSSANGKELRKSKISLIDLAGSERVERTGATGQRLKEGQIINKSLLTLGRCISALAKESARPKNKDGSTKPPKPVPFRESTLTLLLRESLSGNARSVIVAAVSPSSRDALETTSTMRFASTCKELKTRAHVNEVSVSAEVARLKAEVESLRAELAKAAASSGDSGQEEGDERRLAFLESKIATLGETVAPQDIRRVWISAVQEQQRKRVATLFEGVEEEGADLTATPYLYNLDQDPQMQGQLPLPLPSKLITIGRSDSDSPQDLEVARPLPSVLPARAPGPDPLTAPAAGPQWGIR